MGKSKTKAVTVNKNELCNTFNAQETKGVPGHNRTMLMAISTVRKKDAIEKGHYQYGPALMSVLKEAVPITFAEDTSKGQEEDPALAGVKHVILGETGYLHRHTRFLENLIAWFETTYADQLQRTDHFTSPPDFLKKTVFEEIYHTAIQEAKEEGAYWKEANFGEAQKILMEKGQSLHFFSWEEFIQEKEGFKAALEGIKQFSAIKDVIETVAQDRADKWFKKRWERIRNAETLRNIHSHIGSCEALLQKANITIDFDSDKQNDAPDAEINIKEKKAKNKKKVAIDQQIKTQLNILLSAINYLVKEEKTLLVFGHFSQILSQLPNTQDKSLIETYYTNLDDCSLHVNTALQSLYNSQAYKAALQCIEQGMPLGQRIKLLSFKLKETLTILEDLMKILYHPFLWSNYDYLAEETAAVSMQVFKNNTTSWFDLICDRIGSGARIMTYNKEMNPVCRTVTAHQTEEEYQGKIAIMPFVPHFVPDQLWKKPNTGHKKSHIQPAQNAVATSSKVEAVLRTGSPQSSVVLRTEPKALMDTTVKDIQIAKQQQTDRLFTRIARLHNELAGLSDDKSLLAKNTVQTLISEILPAFKKMGDQTAIQFALEILEVAFEAQKEEDKLLVLKTILEVYKGFEEKPPLMTRPDDLANFSLSSSAPSKSSSSYNIAESVPRRATKSGLTSFLYDNSTPSSPTEGMPHSSEFPFVKSQYDVRLLHRGLNAPQSATSHTQFKPTDAPQVINSLFFRQPTSATSSNGSSNPSTKTNSPTCGQETGLHELGELKRAETR